MSVGVISSKPYQQMSIMRDAINEASDASLKLSRGDRFTKSGEGIAELGAARNLDLNAKHLEVAISNNRRAINIIQVSNSIVSQASELAVRASKLAQFASGSQTSDADRIGYQQEFKSILSQMENIGNFEYNGIKLLDGSRSDTAKITSNTGNKVASYDFSSVNDFISTGAAIKSAIIESGTSFDIVESVGSDYTKATIDMSEMLSADATMQIGDIKVEMIAAGAVTNSTDKILQVNVGADRASTYSNIINALQTSDIELLNHFVYKAEAATGVVDNSSAFATTIGGATAGFTNGEDSMLVITATTAGSQYNDLEISTTNADGNKNLAAFNSGHNANDESLSYVLKFDVSNTTGNVKVGESFKIEFDDSISREYVFVETDADIAALANKQTAVRIGSNYAESLQNFVDTVNSAFGDNYTTATMVNDGIGNATVTLNAAFNSESDSAYKLDVSKYRFINNTTIGATATRSAEFKSGIEAAPAGAFARTMTGYANAQGTGMKVVGMALGSGEAGSAFIHFENTKNVADLDTKTIVLKTGDAITDTTPFTQLSIEFSNTTDVADSTIDLTTADKPTITMGTQDIVDNKDLLKKLANILNSYGNNGHLAFMADDEKITMLDSTVTTTSAVSGATVAGIAGVLWGINGDQNSSSAGSAVASGAGKVSEAKTAIYEDKTEATQLKLAADITVAGSSTAIASGDGVRLYFNNDTDYYSVDIDFADVGSTLTINDSGLVAAGFDNAKTIDLTKLKAYVANNTDKVGGNNVNFNLDTIDFSDIHFKFGAIGYADYSGTKKFDNTATSVAKMATLDGDLSNSTSIGGTYLELSVMTNVLADDQQNVIDGSGSATTVDVNGKLMGNTATVTIDFTEAAKKHAAGGYVFDLDIVSINGIDLDLTSEIATDGTGNIGASAVANTFDEKMAALKNQLNNNGSVVDNAKNFTWKEVESNKFEIVVHGVNVTGDNTSDLDNIIPVKFQSATTALADDVIAKVTKVEASNVYNLVELLSDENALSGTGIINHSTEKRFSEKLEGNFVNADVVLTAAGTDTANSAKITLTLDNGIKYQSGDIYLSGNGGDKGKGSKIIGGSTIDFHRVGANANEIGIAMTIQAGGVDFGAAASNIAEMQENATKLNAEFVNSLNDGKVGVGIKAPTKLSDDLGIKSLEQFVVNGAYDNKAHLSGAIEFKSNVGETRAQGVLDIKQLNTGDIIVINDKKITIGTDVSLTSSSARDALLKYLVESNDAKLNTATYSGAESSKIIITAKNKGVAGNAITIGSDSLATAPAGGTASQITVNGMNQDNANTGLRTLGDDVSQKYVVAGKDYEANNSLSADMIGGIKILRGTFNGGDGRVENGAHLGNSVTLEMQIGDQILTADVKLSGGTVMNGSLSGQGYNSLGDTINTGTKVEFSNADKSVALTVTIGEDLKFGASTVSDNQAILNTYINEMFEGTKDISVYQSRNVASFDTAKTIGTALHGLRAEDVSYLSDQYDDSGSVGTIGKFTYDSITATLSVDINNQAHSIVLSDDYATGGYSKFFDSASQKIIGGKDSVLTLKNDNGAVLSIDLSNLANGIDLSSTLAIDMFLKTMNDAFGADSAGGIKYQLGGSSSNTAYLPNLTMEKLFGNDWRSIDVSTVSNAENAYKSLINTVQIINSSQTQVGSDLAAMTKALDNNLSSFESISEAYNDLVKMSFYESSAGYASAEMSAKAAASALQKVNQLASRLFDALNQ